jgi:hypothetical protein
MSDCYDAGALRAYLDGEPPEADRQAVTAHLDACAECRARLGELSALDTRVGAALADATGDAPPAQEAFARLRRRLSDVPNRAAAPTPITRLTRAARSRQSAVGSAVAAALLLVVLLVPPARAAAGSLLQIFRAQSVVYVSVSPNRVQQVQNLQVDANALFISQPKQIGAAPSVQQADSVDAAGALAHFQAGTVTSFPVAPTSTTYTVTGPSTYQVQVNVQTVRQVLKTLGVTDVTIPDSLGAQPITASLPSIVRVGYTGDNYTATLLEGTTPTVSLPSDVDLTKLGQAMLEVYGMSPNQASALSKQIDWRSTVVFPFPTGASELQQVTVNGARGVFLNAGSGPETIGAIRHSSNSDGTSSGSSANSANSANSATNYRFHVVVYWQKGDHFYILESQGNSIGETALLEMADSVR